MGVMSGADGSDGLAWGWYGGSDQNGLGYSQLTHRYTFKTTNRVRQIYTYKNGLQD
jgi:hypothetical protein